jgi:hypothetical protein
MKIDKDGACGVWNSSTLNYEVIRKLFENLLKIIKKI